MQIMFCSSRSVCYLVCAALICVLNVVHLCFSDVSCLTFFTICVPKVMLCNSKL